MGNKLSSWLGLALLLPLAAACNRGPKQPMTPNPPDWMAGEIDRIANSVAPGAIPVGDTFRAIAFREDDHTDWRVQLAPGACYVFVGVGDHTAEEMYIALYDPEDDRVEREKESPSRVALQWCVEKPGLHRIHGKVTEGHGHYHVGLFVNPMRGTPPPLPHPAPKTPQPPSGEPNPGPAPAPVGKPTNLESAIKARAKTDAAGATQVGDFFTGSADKTDWYTALEKGKCYWLIGAGDKGVDALHLYLWDPDDNRVTANKSTENRASVGHCPKVSGMFHFQAKVAAGHGTYKVGVFAKKK